MGKGRKVEYRDYIGAKEFARSLNLRNKEEWTRYAKGELPDKEPKPKDIPSRVDKIYKKNGWTGFDDFLGTKKTKEMRKNYRSFDQARAFVRTLGLTREEEWQTFINGGYPDKGKLPFDIPLNPQEIYKGKGWTNMSDWICDHYHPVVIEHETFSKAREFARSLKLKSIHEWEFFRNGEMKSMQPCPKNIPVWPPHAYKDTGWMSWADWLGLTIGKK